MELEDWSRREYRRLRLEEGRRKWKVFLEERDDDDVLVEEEGKIEKEGRVVVVVAEDELKDSIIIKIDSQSQKLHKIKHLLSSPQKYPDTNTTIHRK